MQRIHHAKKEKGMRKEEEGRSEEERVKNEDVKGKEEEDVKVSVQREGKRNYISILCPLPTHICGIAISSSDIREGWKTFCSPHEENEDDFVCPLFPFFFFPLLSSLPLMSSTF
jgi:hypothetical protein